MSRRSSDSAERGWRSTSLVLTCSTANGFGVNADALMRASSFGSRTRCSPTSAWRRSPSARASSWRRPASTPADGPSRRATTSRRRRRRSRASPRKGHEPRDRRAALHQPEHRRVPPAQGLPEARRKVTHAACEPFVTRRSRRTPGFVVAARPSLVASFPGQSSSRAPGTGHPYRGRQRGHVVGAIVAAAVDEESRRAGHTAEVGAVDILGDTRSSRVRPQVVGEASQVETRDPLRTEQVAGPSAS